MYLYQIPLLVGFLFNSTSAFTAFYWRCFGERWFISLDTNPKRFNCLYFGGVMGHDPDQAGGDGPGGTLARRYGLHAAGITLPT